MNKIFLIGNATKDPTGGTTAGGKAYCRFTIAVNRRGEGTDYFNITAWDRLAEVCDEYIAKGKKLFIEGELRIGEYEGRDGVKRPTIDVTARSVEFLTATEKRAEAAKDGVRDDASRHEQVDVADNDLPF